MPSSPEPHWNKPAAVGTPARAAVQVLYFETGAPFPHFQIYHSTIKKIVLERLLTTLNKGQRLQSREDQDNCSRSRLKMVWIAVIGAFPGGQQCIARFGLVISVCRRRIRSTRNSRSGRDNDMNRLAALSSSDIYCWKETSASHGALEPHMKDAFWKFGNTLLPNCTLTCNFTLSLWS